MLAGIIPQPDTAAATARSEPLPFAAHRKAGGDGVMRGPTFFFPAVLQTPLADGSVFAIRKDAVEKGAAAGREHRSTIGRKDDRVDHALMAFEEPGFLQTRRQRQFALQKQLRLQKGRVLRTDLQKRV